MPCAPLRLGPALRLAGQGRALALVALLADLGAVATVPVVTGLGAMAAVPAVAALDPPALVAGSGAMAAVPGLRAVTRVAHLLLHGRALLSGHRFRGGGALGAAGGGHHRARCQQQRGRHHQRPHQSEPFAHFLTLLPSLSSLMTGLRRSEFQSSHTPSKGNCRHRHRRRVEQNRSEAKRKSSLD